MGSPKPLVGFTGVGFEWKGKGRTMGGKVWVDKGWEWEGKRKVRTKRRKGKTGKRYLYNV